MAAAASELLLRSGFAGLAVGDGSKRVCGVEPAAALRIPARPVAPGRAGQTAAGGRSAPTVCRINLLAESSLHIELARKSLNDLIQHSCRQCHGERSVPCGCCDGRGFLQKGGYNRRNPVNVSHLIGSKWTAEERTFGWRHFRVASMRKHGKAVFVEMVSCCDETSRFWLNTTNLKDRLQWTMGWKQKSEMDNAKAGEGPVCKACQGAAVLPCPMCAKQSSVFEI
eukprot:jgi/Chlat1/2987/Chrsp2S04705